LRYLTLSELIYINGRLLNNAKIMSGKQKVRDIVLLEAAAVRPSASAFGEDAYPTLADKAAALFHSIVRNHPFTDGNKRTATIAALLMFEVNGERAIWQPEDALATILSAAEGLRDVPHLAAWFSPVPTVSPTDPDAERDMQTIDRLISENKWLLNELENR